MNLDKYGLPVQSNGDAADQLQRVGMIAVGQILAKRQLLNLDLDFVLRHMLQTKTGLYRRYFETNVTNDVTADQLIPAMAYWVLTANSEQLKAMNWCFAQNWRKQGEPNQKTIPDFMLIRALPLLVRGFNIPSLIRTCIDVLLLLAGLINNLVHRGLDDVDDNNLIITLCVCNAVKPTIVSRIARLLYKLSRAPSYGGSGPSGALRWYHRSDAGGNPEIADLFLNLI